ncbi:class I SAM-dependent methyltransferase [Ramlibacter humi]|uniref:class I SAM-dependent methyltransferase n=1 Tax=Ramlibacter humi TaxID=2530451 RepID=UPI001430D410|nr:class I SAM-dependent methyltransferase [Ramlibacter humi]
MLAAQQLAPARHAEAPAEALPIERSHPDAMALVARLFGLLSAAPATARILEMGCADGGNIVPLAALLPRAQFVGMDTRPNALREAAAFAARVGVRNVTFLPRGLESMPAEIGEFDYIICHEPFSSLPAHVQYLVLQQLKQRLAPNGVGYLSYQCGGTGHRGPASASGQRPVTTDRGLRFTQVADRLMKAGLQYLGEADFVTMLPSNLGTSAEQVIKRVSQRGIVAAEQAMDYLRRRSYRETLVCHGDVRLKRRISVEDIAPLYLSAATQEMRSSTPGGAARYQAANGAYVTTSSPALQHALKILQARYPARLTMRQLMGTVGPVHEADRTRLAYSIFSACMSGVVSLALSPLPVGAASSHPVAWSVARDQAVRQRWVSNLQHRLVLLEDFPLHLHAISLLDGKLDLDQLAASLAALVASRASTLSTGEQTFRSHSGIRAQLMRAGPLLVRDLAKLGLIADEPARRL